jgi:hypothetical protein
MNHSQNVRFNWNRSSILMEEDVIILSSSMELALDGSLRVNFFFLYAVSLLKNMEPEMSIRFRRL